MEYMKLGASSLEERFKHITRFAIGEIEYDAFVHLVVNCSGGCTRGLNRADPLLRPAGGFQMPSTVMFVLGQPNLLDHREYGCLAMSREDFPGRSPDMRALSLYGICNILGFSHKDIFIWNSLLCWQATELPDWRRSWQPCLNQGWLYRAIELCAPRIIVTFGPFALKAVNYVLGGPTADPVLSDYMDSPVTRRGIYLWPLLHEKALLEPGDASAWQWESCKRLRVFMSEEGISVIPRALTGLE